MYISIFCHIFLCVCIHTCVSVRGFMTFILKSLHYIELAVVCLYCYIQCMFILFHVQYMLEGPGEDWLFQPENPLQRKSLLTYFHHGQITRKLKEQELSSLPMTYIVMSRAHMGSSVSYLVRFKSYSHFCKLLTDGHTRRLWSTYSEK